jgi:hypothetical protein
MHGIWSRCERPSHPVDSQRRGFRNSRSRRGFDRCAAVVSHHAQGAPTKRLVALPTPPRRWPMAAVGNLHSAEPLPWEFRSNDVGRFLAGPGQWPLSCPDAAKARSYDKQGVSKTT